MIFLPEIQPKNIRSLLPKIKDLSQIKYISPRQGVRLGRGAPQDHLGRGDTVADRGESQLNVKSLKSGPK